MDRQHSLAAADTWVVEDLDGEIQASRDLGRGWTVEHRIDIVDRDVSIIETRVRSTVDGVVPVGGIDSEVLRLGLLQGVREAVVDARLARPLEDLRGYDGLQPSPKRSGEPRRWDLAITAFAYVQTIAKGSYRPNEDVADAMGLSVKAVTDRLYHARRFDPPLLTGGGRQGHVGEPQITEAGMEALAHRMGRLVASLGPPPSTPASLFVGGEGAGIGSAAVALLRDAERRIPGIWAMDMDEVRTRGAEAKPPWADELLETGEIDLQFVRDRRPDKPTVESKT